MNTATKPMNTSDSYVFPSNEPRTSAQGVEMWRNFLVFSSIVEEEGIVWGSCKYDQNAFQDNLYDIAGVQRFSRFSRAVTKRKAEYLAGRHVAQQSLYKLDGSLCDIPIGVNRAPVWPSHCLGSISHTSDIAVCAVTNQQDNVYLGLDVEMTLSKQSRQDIESLITFDSEITHFQSAFENREALVTFIFSAKESLFKALYPFVNVYFDFLDAEIISVDNEQFEIRLVNSINATYKKGMTFKGHYAQSQEKITTVITNKKISLKTFCATF